MGDLEAIIEKMKAVEDYEVIQKKMEDVMSGKSKLTLRDMYKQITAVRKMGPLSKILQMIPGVNMMGDIPEDQVKVGEKKMERWLAIMNSMTYEELDNPSIIDKQRMRRIAFGSGTEVDEVKDLIEHYNMVQRTLKTLKRRKKDVEKLFGQMGS